MIFQQHKLKSVYVLHTFSMHMSETEYMYKTLLINQPIHSTGHPSPYNIHACTKAGCDYELGLVSRYPTVLVPTEASKKVNKLL